MYNRTTNTELLRYVVTFLERRETETAAAANASGVQHQDEWWGEDGRRHDNHRHLFLGFRSSERGFVHWVVRLHQTILSLNPVSLSQATSSMYPMCCAGCPFFIHSHCTRLCSVVPSSLCIVVWHHINQSHLQQLLGTFCVGLHSNSVLHYLLSSLITFFSILNRPQRAL